MRQHIFPAMTKHGGNTNTFLYSLKQDNIPFACIMCVAGFFDDTYRTGHCGRFRYNCA